MDSAATCIRCDAALQIRSPEAEGKAAIYTFPCPLCGCPNTVSVIACTAILCLIPCVCGKAVEVTIAPNLAPLAATAEGERPDESGVTYAHMTMTRSRVHCPECNRPYFVFGAVSRIA